MFALTCFLLTVVCLSLATGWRDLYHFSVGAGALCVIAPAYWIARRYRRGAADDNHGDVSERPGWLANALFASAKGVAFWGLLLPLFYALQQLGIYDEHLDRNRAEFERRLATVTQAGALEEALSMVRGELKEKHSDEWHKSLVEELYRLLVDIGKQSEVAKHLVHFDEALSLTTTYDFLDDEPARTLLQRAREDHALAEEVALLQSRADWQEAVSLIRSAMTRRPRDKWPFPFAEWHRDALLAWAEHCQEPKDRVAKYTEALEVARQHGLNSQAVEALVASATSTLAAREQFLQKVEQLKREKNWSSLARFLEEHVAESREPWHPALVADLYLAQYLAGDSAERLDDRARWYRLAENTARSFSLDRGPMEARKRQLERSEQLRSSLKALFAAADYPAAAALAETSLAEQSPKEWALPLDVRLRDLYVAWGDSVNDLAERQDKYCKARDVAKRFQLDADVADARLLLVKDKLNDRESLLTVYRDSIRKRQFAELISVIRFKMNQQPKDEWAHPYSDWLLQAHLAWDDSLNTDSSIGTLENRERLLEQALNACAEYQLDDTPVVERLDSLKAVLAEQLRAETERKRPATLPMGSRAGFIRVSTDSYPPIVLADIWVEDSSGIPVLGLLEKDFTVECAGRPVTRFTLAPVEKTPPPLCLVIAIDVSGSTGGKPLELAKEGAKLMLSGLTGSGAKLRILAFGDAPRWCGEWTDDLQHAVRSLEPLRPEGRTAFFAAIAAILADMRDKKGEKRVVVFTDGKDNVGGATIADLRAWCKRDQVIVDVIGLRTTELDSTTLQQLATATGGSYVEANDPGDVLEQFQRASRQIRRKFYRLAIEPDEQSKQVPAQADLRLTIGAGNPVVAATHLTSG